MAPSAPGKTFGRVIARIVAVGATRRTSEAIAAMFSAKSWSGPAEQPSARQRPALRASSPALRSAPPIPIKMTSALASVVRQDG